MKIDEKLLFVNQQGKPVLCYLPDYEKNIFEQIRELLEENMENMSYGNKKTVRFYYEFHSYLVKERPNIFQIKEYLKPTSQIIPKEESENPLEEEFYLPGEEKKTDRNIYFIIIFLLILSFLLLGAAAFFAVKIFIYGFYYQFVLGFMVFISGFLADSWKLWKLWENESKEKMVGSKTDDMKTEYLLEDEEKTVCLVEQPLGRLISKKNTEEIIIEHDEFVIGSSNEGTDYQISAVGVSRRHVKIFLENGKLEAEDLKSTNGTMINGRKITRKKLETGDILKIGLEEFEFLSDMGYTI